MHQRLATIRSFIAREQLLFGNARVNRIAVEQRVGELRQHDEDDATRLAARDAHHGQRTDSSNVDTTNPSVDASIIAMTDENGFGDKDQPLGWFNHMQTRREKLPAQTRKGQLYESLGAAGKAASENAAELSASKLVVGTKTLRGRFR